MICKRFSSFIIVLFSFLALGKTSFGQGCDLDGLNCISCTDYQICNEGFSTGRVISCKSGNACADDELKKCQMKLNCYALSECLQQGIYPDPTADSNYFVCLSDGDTGFLKFDFSCKDEEFFDKSVLGCVPRSITSPITDVVQTSSNSPETSPSASPTETSPSTSPTETSPSTSPTETSQSTSPTETSPSSSPTETSPSTSPTETSPSTSPTETSPSTSPTETSPSTSPTETSPSTSPTETSPSTSPTETSPSTSPTETSPSTSPTETSPSTSPTATSPSTFPTTISPSTQPTPHTTPSPQVSCTGPGIFPYPGNCKMYYRCSSSLKAFIYICPGNSYFNENTLKCSMIITPACREQILKNSTSTLPPFTTTTPKPTTTTPTTTITPKPTPTPTITPKSTTTTPTTTITPKPTTNTPTTVTAVTTSQSPPTTPTNPPFSCPMAGVFENPSDCKTYYRCSKSGKYFRYVCPGATYFNEITKRCSLTITTRCKSLI